jgi:ABC-type nitrate/sulfonate/bicarbonate transport system permease component
MKLRSIQFLLPWLAGLAAWEIAGRAGLLSRFIFPWPSLLVSAFWNQLLTRDLILDVAWSLARVGGGFLLAAVLGTLLGFAIGLNRSLSKLFDPLFNFLRPIPPVAWIPLAIVWFGLGNGPAFFLTFVAAFFPIVLSSAAGVAGIAKPHFQVAECLQASRWLVFKRVVLPGSLPHVLAGYRIAFGVSWMAVVAAEMIAAKSGLGHLIQVSQDVLRTDLVMVGMILIGMIGLLFDFLFRRAALYFVPWEKA